MSSREYTTKIVNFASLLKYTVLVNRQRGKRLLLSHGESAEWHNMDNKTASHDGLAKEKIARAGNGFDDF